MYWYNMGSRKLIKFVHSKLSADDGVCVCKRACFCVH